MILRIALKLARNPAPEHRWRRVAVPVAAIVFMLLLLVGTSVLLLVIRETEREVQRIPVEAQEPSPTDLFMLNRDDVWDDKQFFVWWIEPATDTEPILPPGVTQLPDPGQAVVSPALDRLASRNPTLAKRYPDRLVIGGEGIRSEDELFSYVRVQEERSIQGDDLATRAGSFGALPGAGSFLARESYTSSEAPVAAVSMGVFGFVVMPGVLVLAVGVATGSNLRDHRFEVLGWVGAPIRTLTVLAMVETMILAMPGLILITVFWAAIAPSLEQVPLVGHDVVRGDLMLPGWLLLLELAISIVVVGLMAVAVTAIRRTRRRVARPRPASGQSSFALLRIAPLSFVLVALVLSKIIQSTQGTVAAAYLYLAAMVVAVFGVPLILPGILRAVGKILGQARSVPTSIAGRSLQWDPVRASRPFVGLSALIVVALVGSMYIALASNVEAKYLPTGETFGVFVEWPDPQSSDPAQLAKSLGEGTVVPFSEGGHAHKPDESRQAHEHGETLLIGASCRHLAPHFAGTRCNPEAPYRLPAKLEQGLERTLVPVAHTPDVEAKLTPADNIANSGRAFVLDNEPLGILEQRVRTAAMQEIPAPYVDSWLGASARSESPLIPWLVGAIVSAVGALAIGCLASLVDRLLGTRKHRRHLLNLGLSPRRLMAFEAWRFAAPFGAVVAISFSVGFAICVLITSGPGVGMPWYGISVTLSGAVLAGLIGTASVAFLGVRSICKASD